MADLKTLCIAGICSDVANPDDFATKTELNAKQDKLTAGQNITITGNTISATDTTYTAGTGIDITNGVISTTIDADVFVPVSTLPDASTADENKIYLVPKTGGGVEEWHVIDEGGTPTWDKFGEEDIDLDNYYTKTETDALLDDKQDALTAGENVTIANGVISATDTTYENATQSTAGLMSAADKTKLDGMTPSDYLTCATVMNCPSVTSAFAGKQDTLTAGDNITIENGVISAAGTDLTNYYTKTETDNLLGDKQDTLTAGSNITISGGTISATDTTYTGGDNVTISAQNVISVDAYNKAYVDALEARIAALEALLDGKSDIPIVKTNHDDTSITVNVLGEVVTG